MAGQGAKNLHAFHHLSRVASSQSLLPRSHLFLVCWKLEGKRKNVWEMKAAQVSLGPDVSETPGARVHCPGCPGIACAWLWGLELSRTSHMGAANAVGACVSLPSWSLCCSDCQHPSFSWPSTVAWEEETFQWQCGHITRSRWVHVGVITQHCKSRLKMETCPPLNSGLCCKGCSEV